MAPGIEMGTFAEQLRRQLAEIDAALGMASASSSVVELDQTRTGRLSRMDAMQQQALGSGMLERLRQQRRRILAALDRMDQGTFGVCCQCHESIPLERLGADPATPFCSGCQQEIDQRRTSG